METNDTNIFLSGTLLRLNKASGTIDADDQTTSDFGVKSAAVASFINPTRTMLALYAPV